MISCFIALTCPYTSSIQFIVDLHDFHIPLLRDDYVLITVFPEDCENNRVTKVFRPMFHPMNRRFDL